MTLKQALEIIDQICANYQGTLKEHTQIQTALKVIHESIEKEKKNA